MARRQVLFVFVALDWISRRHGGWAPGPIGFLAVQVIGGHPLAGFKGVEPAAFASRPLVL
jgi:hypothetical protein